MQLEQQRALLCAALVHMGALSSFGVFVIAVITVVTASFLEWLLKLRRRRAYVTRVLAAQGISGPAPASLIGGNSREVFQLKREAEAQDMDVVSHDTLLARIHPFEHKYLQVYGKNMLAWVAWEPTVFTAEPQLIHEVLTSRSFVKSGIQKTMLMPLFGRGMIMASGDEWTSQRRMMSPVFHSESVKGMISTMEQCASCMIQTWEQLIRSSQRKCAAIDAHSMLIRLTAEVMTRTAFGSAYEGTDRYIHLAHKLQEQLFQQPFFCLIPGYRLLPTKFSKDLNKVTKEIESCVNKMIEERVRESKGDPTLFGRDVLGLLLEAMHKTEQQQQQLKKLKVSRQLLVDQCKELFFAGHETSAQTITWAMMLLALHPEWQEKARQEVREALGDNVEHLDADKLSKLKTLGKIISETLRLYPPATMVRRGACEDTHIGGKDGTARLFIPKGVYLSLCILSLHHDKSLWGADACEFRPDRFTGSVPAGAYLPFGAGPKVCLGRSFALVETKLVLSMLLSKFQWTLSPAYRHAPTMRVTLHPEHGMPLLVSALR